RRSAGVISRCCQIPRYPENFGQIRSTKKRDEIPHFPRKGPLGRPIFCVYSEGIRPQKAFEVLNQPGGDDRRPSPWNPKSPTKPWPFQRRSTHLEAGSSMTPGQKISKAPKVPKKIAISIGSLGQAQPTSNARTHRSEENPISPGRKLVEKPLGLSARNQPNRWHTTRSHDEQAEMGISHQGDEILRQDIVHELSKAKVKYVKSGKVWHLDFHPHQQNCNKSDSGFCRSSMQHRNSIVTSFRAVECEIPTGTGSSLS
ncbi:hypothetical protein IGI04_042846, partial [Brassica rapa subsp. trilocularis]